MMRDRHVVVMARKPEHGKVKTRLAEALGPDAALSFYTSTLRRTLKRLGDDPRWNTVVAATPLSAARDPGRWTRGLPVVPQETGDLGQRMQGAFDAVPAGPVVIVGSDIPDLSARHVARAFRVLEGHDAVFGPSDDGGYWLVGIAHALRNTPVFGPVRWSTRHALDDTLQGLPDGAHVATLETLADIDTADDLKRWRA